MIKSTNKNSIRSRKINTKEQTIKKLTYKLKDINISLSDPKLTKIKELKLNNLKEQIQDEINVLNAEKVAVQKEATQRAAELERDDRKGKIIGGVLLVVFVLFVSMYIILILSLKNL